MPDYSLDLEGHEFFSAPSSPRLGEGSLHDLIDVDSLLVDHLFEPPNLLVADHARSTVRRAKDVAKVLVLRVEDLVKYLGLHGAIIGLFRWVIVHWWLLSKLIWGEGLIAIFWTSVLNRLLKVLLLCV